MGRLASKRRIKSVDPFSKTGGVARRSGNIKAPSTDLAPKAGSETFFSQKKLIWTPGSAKPGFLSRKRPSKSSAKRERPSGASTIAPKAKETAAAAAKSKETPSTAPAKTLMPQLERQPGESLRKFKARLREAAKAAMMHNRDHQGGFRRVSDSRRAYMSRKANHEKNKHAAKLVDKAEKRPELGTALLAGIQHQKRHRTGSESDSENNGSGRPAGSGALLVPKDIAIEQAVLSRGVTWFGDRAMEPPELRPTGRLARMLPGSRTATAAERMLQRAAHLSSTAQAAAASAGVETGMWQGGLSRREARAATLAAEAEATDAVEAGRVATSAAAASTELEGAAAGDRPGTRLAEAGQAARLEAAREESVRAYAALRQRRSEAVRRAAGNLRGATKRGAAGLGSGKRPRMTGGAAGVGSLATELSGAGMSEFDM